jgi:hypothetical protein
MFPYRGMLATWLLEFVLFMVLIVLPQRYLSMEMPLPARASAMGRDLLFRQRTA